MQGPYVYQLYISYGFSLTETAELFVGGYASSMGFGTAVDRCLLYAVIYSASCVTKLFQIYWVLMLGRCLSGIATSLLYSSFESWMIREHSRRGFAPELLHATFSYAIIGNDSHGMPNQKRIRPKITTVQMGRRTIWASYLYAIWCVLCSVPLFYAGSSLSTTRKAFSSGDWSY
jgi:hypothetical protein